MRVFDVSTRPGPSRSSVSGLRRQRDRSFRVAISAFIPDVAFSARDFDGGRGSAMSCAPDTPLFGSSIETRRRLRSERPH